MKHKIIRTTVQKHGFEGILYLGRGSMNKVMIVMSGSNGGMTLTAKEAEFYHNNGIPALALALFGTKQRILIRQSFTRNASLRMRA